MPDDADMKSSESKSADAKSSAFRKFLWNALDRIFFIAMGAVGTVATSYITGVLKVNPPELVVRQSFSRIDSASPVARSVGGLKLDYKEESPRPYGVFRLDIANEGRGPAEKVRFQVKLPPALGVAYDEEPDLKVYRPVTMSLEKNEFYSELATFPSGAADFLALRVEGDEKLLCGARVKFVNDEFEGEVEDLKGVEGCK